jgi:Na+/serine symporter
MFSSRHNSKLFRGLEGDDLKHFIASYQSGRLAREQLVEVLKDKINQVVREDENVKKLSSQNYVLEMADSIGYRRALREAITLMNQELDNG